MRSFPWLHISGRAPDLSLFPLILGWCAIAIPPRETMTLHEQSSVARQGGQQTTGLSGLLLTESITLCCCAVSPVWNPSTNSLSFRVLCLSFMPFPGIIQLCLAGRVRERQVYTISSRLEVFTKKERKKENVSSLVTQKFYQCMFGQQIESLSSWVYVSFQQWEFLFHLFSVNFIPYVLPILSSQNS